MDNRIFLLHTHYLPFPGCDGILVAEQDAQNFNKYYGCNIDSNLSLKDFFLSPNANIHPRQGFSIEQDLNLYEFMNDVSFYKRKKILSILPYRNKNLTYYNNGNLTNIAKLFLKFLQENNIALDCTHMPEEVIISSLDFYCGPLLFSHSMVKSKNSTRLINTNEISLKLIPVIKNYKSPFLIGVPVINDLISWV